MKKLSIVLLFFLFLNFPYVSIASDREMEVILTASEGLFKAMKGKNYKRIWESITHKSQKTIEKDVYKAIIKSGTNISEEQVSSDFTNCANLCQSYWNAFLINFDPDLVLNHSKWEMGTVKKDEAEIIITYKKSERPAILKLFKEGGQWRVGLVETFWTRK